MSTERKILFIHPKIHHSIFDLEEKIYVPFLIFECNLDENIK